MTMVTRDGWSVSYTTGNHIDGAILNVCKIRNNGKIQRGNADGKVFASSDEAKTYAFEHGYLMPHVAPTCPDCKVIHWFLGHRSGWCDVNHKFIV